jgi:spermidine/putrescine-binding protein
MVQKMIENDLLTEIDYSKIPNISNIDPEYLKKAENFDPGNKYCVPYCWGTVGILYNKTMVDDDVNSWDILFNEKYKGEILMMDSVRDAYMIALNLLGYDPNTTDKSQIEEATEKLKSQYPLVQAYVVDQVRDKMISGEAALGVIYSGEAIYTKRENPDLEYVVPDEGSNVWIDGWVIPKNCKSKDNAEAWINYMCQADVALANFEYITYSTPNAKAREMIADDDIKNSEVAFPSDDILSRCTTYNFLGDDIEQFYLDQWNSVKSE